MLALSWLYPFCIAPLRGKVEACFHIRLLECQQDLSPVKSKPHAFPQIHFVKPDTISSSLEVCYATIQFVRRKNLRYNHVGLFMVLSIVFTTNQSWCLVVDSWHLACGMQPLSLLVAEGSLEVKCPTIWTDEKAEVGRVREEKEEERR